jgi:hypothetical protein
MIAPVPRDLDHARERIEAIPTEERRDRAFDTLSGGVIRLFAQLNELEVAYRAERAERIKLADEVARISARLAPGAQGPQPIERLRPPPRVRNGRPID